VDVPADVPIDVTVRLMTEADVDGAGAVQINSFDDHDRRHGDPVPETTPERVEQVRRRISHLLTHDPEGAWVATVGNDVVGVALALKRDRLWGLSLLVVDPALQSGGVGRRLLHAALTYAEPDAPAVILSSRDPRAMRLYAAAGFGLHPQVRANGAVAASRLRTPELPVRDGTPADFDLADAVDIAVRGAPHGPDHTSMASRGPMFVVDAGKRRGYAYLRGGGVATLAATDEVTATALLWRCLANAAEAGVDAQIDHIAGNQQWVVRAAVEAGLLFNAGGPVMWRNGSPPAAYLPSGAYL
jgi:GNAT superfamily N-acetyltransferase